MKAAWHLWLVGIVAALFNFIGVFDFVMAMAQGAQYMAKAGMSPEQIAHYQAMPGLDGRGMGDRRVDGVPRFRPALLPRKIAFAIFVASLAAFLVHLLYTYVLTNGLAMPSFRNYAGP